MKRNNINYFAYVTSLLLLLTTMVLLYDNNVNSGYAQGSTAAVQPNIIEEEKVEDISLQQQPVDLFIQEDVPAEDVMQDNIDVDVSQLEEQESVIIEENPVEIISPKKYMVTAYYLNLREGPSSQTKILDVLEKDTVIEIKPESNGTWLELVRGGFVHSNYVELVEEEEAQAQDESVIETNTKKPEVKILSYEPTHAINTNVIYDEIINPIEHGVNTISNLTVEQIAFILEGTNLAGIEEAIIEAEKNENVNALFTVAVAKLESANGNSKLAKNKNNLFGLNAYGSDPYKNASSYESTEECVLEFGEIINERYIEKGHTTISQINKKYASDQNWKNKVSSIIKKDLDKLKKKNFL